VSSHSVRLAKNLRDIEKMKDAQKLQRMTEYNRGLYNGMEMFLALPTNRKPEYTNKETKKTK